MTWERLGQDLGEELHRLPCRGGRDRVAAEPLPRDPHLDLVAGGGADEPAGGRPVVLDVVPSRSPSVGGHQQPVRLGRRHGRELARQHDPGRTVMRRSVQEIDESRLLPATAQDRPNRSARIIDPGAGFDVEPQGWDLGEFPRCRTCHERLLLEVGGGSPFAAVMSLGRTFSPRLGGSPLLRKSLWRACRSDPDTTLNGEYRAALTTPAASVCAVL